MSSQPINVPSSPMAVASLVLGILSWVVLPILGAIGAIICGHLARREIRAARGAVGGDGMATVGLVLGYAHLVVMLIALVVVMLFFGGLFAVLLHAAH
ncbi:DUF4190 domain-containing protein [Lysobacter sp. TY2-98]|uniref:DUF4190 domain-containing protein n=1 Tax=Lysobacter sp. TY2-98 TaxID=2290922 RepID=UPI000E1FC93A|nr:DUF4190 domain-containing protein [Lysobacter sp. TY2-98]AXK72278.1 DUF4190 domain-containing protein [Lysobacter sp. TY2-98]